MDERLEWLNEVSKDGKRVCASRARDEYQIPDSVLKRLHCEFGTNPHYRSAGNLAQVISLSCLIDASASLLGQQVLDQPCPRQTLSTNSGWCSCSLAT